jgi:hypothetical protein
VNVAPLLKKHCRTSKNLTSRATQGAVPMLKFSVQEAWLPVKCDSGFRD